MNTKEEKFSSADYWEQRYRRGEGSGLGSRGKLLSFKSEVINEFIQRNSIKKILDHGVGDGTQAKTLDGFEHYWGYDPSPTSIAICGKKGFDPRYTFSTGLPLTQDYCLSLSLDVLYHLVEDEILFNYLDNLFKTPWVIIYSMDTPDGNFSPHVRPRLFSEIITQRYPQYKLIQRIPQRYPSVDHTKGSLSDFLIYRLNP